MHITCGVCHWSGRLEERPDPYIAWCPACRTGLTVPPPGRDITTDGVFADSYADRLAERNVWRAEARHRVEWLGSLVPVPGPVLELGAATGEFVEAAEGAGYVVTGVEPSEWAARHARDLTTSVYNGDLAAYRRTAPDARFPVVVMFHVLEHVPDPGALLREVHAVLAPGGALVLEVPNGGILSLADDGTTWWMRSLHDHVHHFRPDTLRRLLHGNGFEPGVEEWTMRAAYDAGASPLDRLREVVKRRRLSETRDLLRVVARPVALGA